MKYICYFLNVAFGIFLSESQLGGLKYIKELRTNSLNKRLVKRDKQVNWFCGFDN